MDGELQQVKSMNLKDKIDPKLDLILERDVELKPSQLYKAWTQPEILMQWFCPLPWKTVECEIDLRPGGIFRTVMQSPEGEKFPNSGCFLEVVKNRKLIFTDALLPDFRPVEKPASGAGLYFTGIISFEPMGNGTKYIAIAMHKDEEDCKKHAAMGFHQGWGIALDQLIAVVGKSLTRIAS